MKGRIASLPASDTVRPKPAVGFSIAYRVPSSDEQLWNKAHESVLEHFPWLQTGEIQVGLTRVRIWSHFAPALSTRRTDSGAVWILVGSPLNQPSWQDLDGRSQTAERTGGDVVLPWEGRCVLIRVDPCGERWDLWNDWAASVPVFHASTESGGVASSLEPVVVTVANLTTSSLSKRGLTELLLLGHFLDTDTLYDTMRVLPPDSHAVWYHGANKAVSRCWTVSASDSHFSTGSARLIDEMYDLTQYAISTSLTANEGCPISLPLSSGMDSRLIACVAATCGHEVTAYTYGPAKWAEVQFANRVADALSIQWQRVEIQRGYHAQFVQRWLDWFGTSLHVHGTYQFPFLHTIKSTTSLIPNGFYGNNMAGGDHPNDCLFQANQGLLDRICGYGMYWDRESLAALLDFDPTPYYSEIEDLLENQLALIPDWSEYHKMNAIDMWNRQARFIFYQPVMYSYYGLERSPFMHREYARFCMSLPDHLLRKRKLQIDMLDKCFAQVGRIPGTFRRRLTSIGAEPHSVRYRLALWSPRVLGPLVGITWSYEMQSESIAFGKWNALCPITPNLADTWPFRSGPILDVADRSFSGDISCVLKLLPVQAVLDHLLAEARTDPASRDRALK
jgi:hypothetical protein